MRVLMPVGVSTPGGGKVDRGGECSRADACIGVSTPGGEVATTRWVITPCRGTDSSLSKAIYTQGLGAIRNQTGTFKIRCDVCRHSWTFLWTLMHALCNQSITMGPLLFYPEDLGGEIPPPPQKFKFPPPPPPPKLQD